MTARTIAEGGPLLAYEIPVLGKPWAIPFEFPFYQWLVAALSQTGIALEQSGRWISVLAFYATLWPLLSILRRIGVPRDQYFVPLTLFVASPLYLFYSHAFLIESLALFLAVLYIAVSLRYLAQPTRRNALLVFAVGSVAALTKITTFFVAIVPVILAALAGRRWKRTGVVMVVTAVAVFVAIGWNAYADALKTANPLADGFVTSDALQAWNFGTLRQKLSLVLWAVTLERSLPEIAGGPHIGGLGPLILVGAASAFSAKYRVPAFFALAAFVTGPLVFTNLYIVHSYYFSANGVYLLAFCAFGVLTLLDASKVISQITRWAFGRCWSLRASPRTHGPMGDAGERSQAPPCAAGASRRAIGGMLIGGPIRRDEVFAREHARLFGLSPEPIARVAMGDFYVRR